ncbi:TPA: tetratricopeptide repeat protein [archaeon]|uniref:Tetratricopeptide repeat protein n=1 Tax=Candidatus Naiadarchaeum limnaeum TaxID=2756139 RepID=A0A832UT07_9ARCH|nr:tetratricopeptide repeat protein [Candidatus Naiadarchaeum limnaeum]
MTEDFLAKFLEEKNEELKEQIDQAREFYMQKRYSEASALCAIILSDYPNDIDTLLLQGLCFKKQGNLEVAIKDFFDKILELAEIIRDKDVKSKVKEAAMLNKANCLLELGYLDGALNLYNRVLRINPRQWHAMYGKQRVYAKNLQIALAQEWSHKAELTKKRYPE